MSKKIYAAALVMAAAALVLTGCGQDDSADIAKCIKQVEQTRSDAGGKPTVSPSEKAACNDPDKRRFILSGS